MKLLRPGFLRRVACALLPVFLVGAAVDRSLAQGSVCAEGGGSIASDDWAKPAFEWMMGQALPLAQQDGGGIRVVILGSMDEGEVAPTEAQFAEAGDEAAERFKGLGATSIRQLYVNAANARDETIEKTIGNAHIIWMRGGSQTRYCQAWKGTPVEAGIRSVFKRGGVVGGTSAGCAVLGEVIYDAAGGSCEAGVALRDPFAKEISFTTGFLELTPGVIFDSHFTERARIARLAVFLGRVRSELGRDVLGIGMDTRTALCIAPDGAAQVFGTGAACFMHLTPASRLTIKLAAGEWPTPPTVTDVAVRQIVAGDKINVRELVAGLMSPEKIKEGLPASVVEPVALKKEVDRSDTRFIRGDATKHAERGQLYLDGEMPRQALWEGTLVLSPGTGEVPGSIVATRSLSLKERTQNAAGGVLWGLVTTDARWGSFMDAGAALRLTDDGTVQSYFPNGKLGAAMSAPVFVKAATFKAGKHATAGARQSCAFDGLRMHVLGAGWSFDPATGAAIAPAAAIPGTPGEK